MPLIIFYHLTFHEVNGGPDDGGVVVYVYPQTAGILREIGTPPRPGPNGDVGPGLEPDDLLHLPRLFGTVDVEGGAGGVSSGGVHDTLEVVDVPTIEALVELGVLEGAVTGVGGRGDRRGGRVGWRVCGCGSGDEVFVGSDVVAISHRPRLAVEIGGDSRTSTVVYTK